MAKGIGARVPKTSGAGVSRYSYQRGYDLGNQSRGGLADFKTSTQDTPKRRSYGKRDDSGGNINVSYGSTYTGPDDIEAAGKSKRPKSSVKLDRGKDREIK